ncbi:MAG: hypothetical protein ABH934_02000 [Chloroflexota bacterium]
MKINKLRMLLILAVASAMACILQVIGLVLYLGRSPNDWVGIGLYSATIIAFAVAAFGFFAQWKRQKSGD